MVAELMAINHQGDVAIGGTEWPGDGHPGIVLARYDEFGSREQIWHYSPPPGYCSATLKSIDLTNDDRIEFFGQVSSTNAGAIHLESSILFGSSFPGRSSATAVRI